MKGLTGTRAILLLVMIALVGVSIYFVVAYFQEHSREGTLESRIEDVEDDIADLVEGGDIPTLQARLASLQRNLDAAPFPKNVYSTLVFDLIRASATAAGIEDYSFTESAITQKGVNGSDYEYQLYSFEITAVGTLDEIFEFLSEIEDNMPYEAIKTQDVDLVYNSDTESWEIAFEILIFAQPA